MAFRLFISCNLNLRSSNPDGYKVHIAEVDEADTWDAHQDGPVVNNVQSISGQYSTKAEALAAAVHHLPNCQLVENDDPFGPLVFRVLPLGRNWPAEYRLLCRKTSDGVWLAA